MLADLEGYLTHVVGPHFRKTTELSVEDFWLILIWKANRAKTKEKRRFEALGNCTMAEAVGRIARNLSAAQNNKERLKYLMRVWGMRLATSSAVLTILYPDVFTVYDVRVCGEIGRFHELSYRKFSEDLWREYLSFIAAVQDAAPDGLSLRECDHFLWGRSLLHDVQKELRGEDASE